jgi:hypothetical protein
MKYAYENLHDTEFEDLVIFICYELLGSGTQKFSIGPDGGRDARFTGKASHFPSAQGAWEGKIIIQAKHTNGHNKKFSDKEFYSPTSQSNILKKELARIQSLKNDSELDYYMLFSNRRLSGNSNSEIIKYLSTNTGIPESNIYLFGTEQIELYLKQHPKITEMLNIDPIDSPLTVSPDDLAEIIEALASHNGIGTKILEQFPTERTSYDDKNKLNNMSEEYAKTFRKKCLKETAQIRDFLAAPENAEFVQLYENIITEFQLKIIAKKNEEHTFDDVMEHLYDLLIGRDATLRANKRLTRIMLFYMYWNCDIGKSNDSETE